ncbi:Sec20-domain-containing protein [Lipomyces tetrasporus]|uniref:Sec20-domain-containing protein n=1 Tax=Lipomyces tetrasporus TaxID=54092 RepID=A0AAD7QLT5_9ASCO|nr:Sec20-domain-containing protein [Lipomyces tetrasporus]KAJ8097305.1 Sec20-domain-containing protein [Lipomyces tetrasporus]
MPSLESTIDEVVALHTAIAHQITQLLKLATDDEAARSRLASQIHNQLREADILIEAADVLIQDYTATGDDWVSKTALVGKLHEAKEDLKLDRSSYRKAQLLSRQTTLKTQRQERELLFASAKSHHRVSTASTPPVSNALRTAEEATAALRRTHQLLEAEVARSALSLEVLDESNVSLKKLTTQYTAFDVVLGTSRRVISVLEQADKWDRIYMLGAMGFLLLVLCWILWRRVFRVPTRLVIWTLVKGGKVVTWAVGRGNNTTDNKEMKLEWNAEGNVISATISTVTDAITVAVESHTPASVASHSLAGGLHDEL